MGGRKRGYGDEVSPFSAALLAALLGDLSGRRRGRVGCAVGLVESSPRGLLTPGKKSVLVRNDGCP